MIKHFLLFIIIGGLFFHSNLRAQVTYTMSNNYVTDCEGILLDSEEGPEPGQYNHNEDYTFTICVENAKEIVIRFDFFATEATYDVLTVYDGPDTNSPVIATLDDVIQPPPVLIAKSGCVTFHFISDSNLVAIGWSAKWSVDLKPPPMPVLSLDTVFECPLDKGIFKFDVPINCSNFTPGNLNIVGPGNNKIIAVKVLDCDSTTGLGQRFEVVFENPLSEPGTYRILFNGNIEDACGELHDISTNVLFELTNCPIEVYIDLIDAACQGECGTLEAVIIGRSSTTYQFNWSHTNIDKEQIEVCADDSTLITITVTDPQTQQIATAEYWYVPRQVPSILNPLSGDTICASRTDYFYKVSLTGGDFFSTIIPENQRKTGRYQFWRWSNRPGVNEDIVRYVAPNGCEAFDTLYVLPINAGSIQASCLNASAFRMNGGTPLGGEWTGPHVSTDGIFDPTVAGSFVVTYTAPNGCQRNKRVNVAPEIIMPVVDTICSAQTIYLRATPYGGRWRGPGVVNVVNGALQAWRPAPNQSYRYYYTLNGCVDSLDIYIKAITAGPDRAICVEDSLFYLNISGDWSGPGTYLPTENAFDISSLNVGRYTYTLSQDSCIDQMFLYVVQPKVDLHDSLDFCLVDNWYNLLNYLDFNPGYGTFSGTGIKDSVKAWFFNPILAGAGRHLVQFNALGCSVDVWINVEAPAIIPDYAFCSLSTAVTLSADPPGGTWAGPGFLDANSGLFDPQLLGVGLYEIFYTAASGCITSDTIEIFDFEQVNISGIDQQYCYADTTINIILQPPGGTFTINGAPANPQFNPFLLGEGTHEIYYTKGEGACASDERRFIRVLPPISASTIAANDSICPGQKTSIEVISSGGNGTLTPIWDNGLGFGNSHIVRPEQTTLYRVTITDGCSVPYEDSIWVFVNAPFAVNFEDGPQVCFEDTTFVRIIPPNATGYRIDWQTVPPVVGPVLYGQPGIYMATVTDQQSGCTQKYDIQLPGTAPITANFTLIPNGTCLTNIDNRLEFIDLAVGYTDGWITYGDGSDRDNLIDGSLSHDYLDIGTFTITQIVENELGCLDSFSLDICVKNKVAVYIPTVFTPNGDENNDVFQIFGFGVVDIKWDIYSRTGNHIFSADSFDKSWDGTFNGREVNPEVFALRVQYRDRETGGLEVLWQSITLIR